MYVSLPSDKCCEIQHLPCAMLLRPAGVVPQVMFFLGKTTFCANGHAQLQWLCHFLLSKMLSVYHSLSHFFLLTFLFQYSVSFRESLTCSRVQYLCNFSFLHVVVTTDVILHHLAFYFQGTGLLRSCVVPGLVLRARCILPCKNSSCCTHVA